MVKQYKLLKDTPRNNAGDIFHWHSGVGEYIHEDSKRLIIGERYQANVVENSPEWFEEVKPREPRVIWVNELDTTGCGDCFHETEELAIYTSATKTKPTKFIEVIE